MLLANDYIIDIESRSTAKDGEVWAIAIMPVTHNGTAFDLLNSFVSLVDYNAGVVCPETAKWQAKVDNTLTLSDLPFVAMEAFIATTSTSKPIHISELPDMRFDSERPNLWANGKDFDPILLEAAMYRYNLAPADFWHYRQWKDLPTMVWWKDLEHIKKSVISTLDGCPYLHHPLFDCLIERHYLAVIRGMCLHTNESIIKLVEAFEQWLTNYGVEHSWLPNK